MTLRCILNPAHRVFSGWGSIDWEHFHRGSKLSHWTELSVRGAATEKGCRWLMDWRGVPVQLFSLLGAHLKFSTMKNAYFFFFKKKKKIFNTK